MREDERFEPNAAMAMTETSAVETAVRSQLCGAIAAQVIHA